MGLAYAGHSLKRAVRNDRARLNERGVAPSEFLLAWMAEQNDADILIASPTVAEIRRGLLEKPAGKRREQVETWFSGPEGTQSLFAGRILASTTAPPSSGRA